MFSCNANNENNFKAFKFSGNDKYAFKKMLQELKLDTNKNKSVKIQLFGTTITRDEVYEHLETVMSLKSVTAKDNIVDGGVPMYGYGIKHDKEVPKLANFGKNIILLNKQRHSRCRDPAGFVPEAHANSLALWDVWWTYGLVPPASQYKLHPYILHTRKLYHKVG
jgi:hypothetical protein